MASGNLQLAYSRARLVVTLATDHLLDNIENMCCWMRTTPKAYMLSTKGKLCSVH